MKEMRDGKEKRLKVAISELPEEEAAAAGGGVEPAAPSGTIERLGVIGGNPSAEQREELEGKPGVVVEQVNPGPAARAGVRRGDIILRFDNVEVRDLAHLRELVKAMPADKSVPILVQRRGSPIFLALKITED
jgi:serine protease Do